jgi:arylsulfatase A-like enzyme
VPILFWRPGGQGQERFWQIRTVDIAPTLANLIGVAAPATVDGRCLDLGLFQSPACSPVR